MTFLSDESLDEGIVRGLRAKALLVHRALDIGLGGVPDPDVFARAVSEGWPLLTHDRDFIAIAHQHVARGDSHPGLVYAHRDRTTVGAAVRFIASLAARGSDALRNRVEFVPWFRRPR